LHPVASGVYPFNKLSYFTSSRVIDGLQQNTSDRSWETSIHYYHELKCIESILNQLCSSSLLPALMVDMAYIGTTTLFALISLRDELSIPLLILNATLLLDSVIVHIVVYGKAGTVNQVSVDFLEMLKHSSSVQKNGRLRRKARCCTQLKVRVGNSGNFIEVLTPMIITMFTIEQAISLVLLSK
jgi:hypothetical protein